MRLGGKSKAASAPPPRNAETDSAPSGAPTYSGATPPQDGARPASSERLSERLGEMLVRDGVLTHEELAQAIVAQPGSNKRFGELLVELGFVNEQKMITALGAQMGVPFIDLGTDTPEPDVASLLSETVARSIKAIPVRRDLDGTILVATVNPNADVEHQLRQALGTNVRMAIATEHSVKWGIDTTYRAMGGLDQQISAFTSTHGINLEATATTSTNAGITSDAPVVRVVDMIVAQAQRDRASDIHMEPQDARLQVRFRIDGALHDVVELPASIGPALASRIKIMAGMNIVEKRRPQDGQITMMIAGEPLDIRVSTTGVVWGEKVVLRLLDKKRSLLRTSELGMNAAVVEDFGKMLRSSHGMLVCAGPTGSGKTTTLYASLNEIADRERNITTIEDPVEYVFPRINQIQINEAAGITFASGLKSILRQDPDIILVGEIRDLETARIAVQSALTGHFVLSSIHATDAVSSLYRFLDMGVESYLIASALRGIVGQRLVRRTCTQCKIPYAPLPDELEFFHETGGSKSKTEFWVGAGCNYCAQTGYADRIGVYELLEMTPMMRALIVHPNPNAEEMRRVAIEGGMRPLRDEGVRLVEEDVTTIVEIIRSINTA